MIKAVVIGGPGRDADYKEFIMTSASDFSSLPTPSTESADRASPGSQAYTQDGEHTYLLGPDGVWREV